MIQLFDTHRLSYRNAKLRAWALADKTRRVNFQDYSSEDNEWNDIGTDIITDESGYLFYADGTQKIECLGVAEAAIVDVSLDGGHSYLIQFVIQPSHDPSALTPESVFTLSYKNADGQTETYNPALGPARTLPDYLLKSEYSQGDWREGALLCPNDASDYRLTDFTKLILVSRGQYNIDTYTLILPHDNRLRAGQVVYVKNTGNKTVTLNISGGSSITLKPYGVYALRNVFSLDQSAVFDTIYEDPDEQPVSDIFANPYDITWRYTDALLGHDAANDTLLLKTIYAPEPDKLMTITGDLLSNSARHKEFVVLELPFSDASKDKWLYVKISLKLNDTFRQLYLGIRQAGAGTMRCFKMMKATAKITDSSANGTYLNLLVAYRLTGNSGDIIWQPYTFGSSSDDANTIEKMYWQFPTNAAWIPTI